MIDEGKNIFLRLSKFNLEANNDDELGLYAVSSSHDSSNERWEVVAAFIVVAIESAPNRVGSFDVAVLNVGECGDEVVSSSSRMMLASIWPLKSPQPPPPLEGVGKPATPVPPALLLPPPPGSTSVGFAVRVAPGFSRYTMSPGLRM